MKCAILFALMFAGATCFAQTNTDSKGYVTNALLLAPFTFTNNDAVISNAVLVKLTANKFIYKRPDGGEGMLPLAILPTELKAKFGYDPSAAADADSADEIKRVAESDRINRQRGQAAEQAQQNAIWQIVHSHELDCTMKVVQKTETGVLTIWGDIGGDYYFVKGLSKQKMAEIYDEEYLAGAYYRVGTHTYTTVMGASKTVQCLTTSPYEAYQYFSTNTAAKP